MHEGWAFSLEIWGMLMMTTMKACLGWLSFKKEVCLYEGMVVCIFGSSSSDNIRRSCSVAPGAAPMYADMHLVNPLPSQSPVVRLILLLLSSLPCKLSNIRRAANYLKARSITLQLPHHPRHLLLPIYPEPFLLCHACQLHILRIQLLLHDLLECLEDQLLCLR
jgi:hypothetical protein